MKNSSKFWPKPIVKLRDSVGEGLRGLALIILGFYRSHLSVYVGGNCRFEPSCSAYAHEAFRRHRPLTAFHLTSKRLLKCHPFGPFGFDPVPPGKVDADEQ